MWGCWIQQAAIVFFESSHSYSCIEQWATITNSCPLCKEKFTKIEGKTPSPSERKQLRKKIKKVRNRRQRVDHYEDEDEVIELEEEQPPRRQTRPRRRRRQSATIRRQPRHRSAVASANTNSENERSFGVASTRATRRQRRRSVSIDNDNDILEFTASSTRRTRLRRRAPRTIFYQAGDGEIGRGQQQDGDFVPDDTGMGDMDLNEEEESAALEAIYFGEDHNSSGGETHSINITAMDTEPSERSNPTATASASSSQTRTLQRRPLVWIQSCDNAGRRRWTRARRQNTQINIDQIVSEYGQAAASSTAEEKRFESDSLIERIHRLYRECETNENKQAAEDTSRQCSLSVCGESENNGGESHGTTNNLATTVTTKISDENAPLSLHERLQLRLQQQNETL